jgi:hypothetical protein
MVKIGANQRRAAHGREDPAGFAGRARDQRPDGLTGLSGLRTVFGKLAGERADQLAGGPGRKNLEALETALR